MSSEDHRRPAGAPSGSGIPFRAVLTFVGVWLGGSLALVGATLHPVVPGIWPALLGVLLLALIPPVVILRALGGRGYPSAATRIWVARPFWYAMLFLPFLAMGSVVGLGLGWLTGVGRVAAYWSLGSSAILLVLSILAGYRGSRQLVVRRLEVGLPRLPDAFEGLCVVQLSDLHVGPHTPRGHLKRIAGLVRMAEPDLIVLTGDQVDDFARDVEPFRVAFGGLSAPLGVFAIAGNHDVYAGWDAVREGLEDMGLTVLVNQALPLIRGDQRLWLAGTGDPAGTQFTGGGGCRAAPDIAQTLQAVPENEPVVVLAHNPDLWTPLVDRHVDLTLSGHTHYGQLAIPMWNWNAASPFARPSMGFHREGHALLYINPGTNYWGIPFRLGTPPEVTSLTLRQCQEPYIREE